MDSIDRILSASLEEIKNGFIDEDGFYKCLFCGAKAEKGMIYPNGELYCDAQRHIINHIHQEHTSVFEYLLNLDKKFTGLSEHQTNLLRLFNAGKSDSDIGTELGISGSSTIRNHRFVLKEKERQAKVFLALMELLKANDKKTADLIPPHKTAKMVDDRYLITEDENNKALQNYFPNGLEGQLKTFDVKEKNKLVILRHIVKRFEQNNIYTEKEVNQVLKSIYPDYVTLRRYLIEYGFMERKPDGSQYWLREEKDESTEIDRKKELQQQYKEMKKEAGVYQIRNNKNNKIFIVSTTDLMTINGRRFQLQMGSHRNEQLQKEWKEYGEDAFSFDILEKLDEKKDAFFDKKVELKKLEKKWLDKLQPFGDRGYNK